MLARFECAAANSGTICTTQHSSVMKCDMHARTPTVCYTNNRFQVGLEHNVHSLFIDLQSFPVQRNGLFNLPLFPLNVGQVVHRVSMSRVKAQCLAVTLLRFHYLPLLLQCIGKVAVCIREVGLQLDGTAVRVNG